MWISAGTRRAPGREFFERGALQHFGGLRQSDMAVHVHRFDATLADADFPPPRGDLLRRWLLRQRTRRTASQEKHSGGDSRRVLQELSAIAHCISPVRRDWSRRGGSNE